MIPVPSGRLLRHRIRKMVPRYDKCLNPGGEYVESSSTFAVFVPINISIKFGFRIEREKFYPGPGLEHRPLAFHANALTN